MNPSDPKETLRARRKLLATMVSGASAAALIGFNAPSAAASPRNRRSRRVPGASPAAQLQNPPFLKLGPHRRQRRRSSRGAGSIRNCA
jgi:hypothetical protein